MNVQEMNKMELQTIEGGNVFYKALAYLAEKAIEYAVQNPEVMGGLNKNYKLGHVGGGRP